MTFLSRAGLGFYWTELAWLDEVFDFASASQVIFWSSLGSESGIYRVCLGCLLDVPCFIGPLVWYGLSWVCWQCDPHVILVLNQTPFMFSSLILDVVQGWLDFQNAKLGYIQKPTSDVGVWDLWMSGLEGVKGSGCWKLEKGLGVNTLHPLDPSVLVRLGSYS